MSFFEWFVAWRYLFSGQRKALVSVITFISVAGVAVGVAALIVVIGVMDGADELLFGKIADLAPHVRIRSANWGPLTVDEALLKQLRARPDVKLAEPVIEKQAIIRPGRGAGGQERGIRLIGMDELGRNSIFDIGNAKTGEAVMLDEREVLLGYPLAASLGSAAGSAIVLVATNPVKTALYPALKSREMFVKGFFNTKFYDFDANVAFVNSNEIRHLYRIAPGTADYIHIKLKDPFTAEAVKKALNLGSQYDVTTWQKENSDFFGALRLEKLGLFIILLLIILVAAFNIIGTLILMVIEKTREVGILRAMGASQRLVARIFLMDGMMIGLIGTMIGLAAGLLICHFIPMIPFNMPAAIYNFEHLPVKVKLLTVSLIVVSSMIICTLATLFPARQAARLNPVESLRFD